MGENAERVRHIVDLFNEGKVAEVMDAYDDDVEIRSWGTVLGGTYLGKRGLGELLRRIGAASPGGLRLEVENLVESGDQVVVEWSAKGVVPSGRAVESRAANVFEFRGPKVAKHRLYTDTEQLARDVGKL